MNSDLHLILATRVVDYTHLGGGSDMGNYAKAEVLACDTTAFELTFELQQGS